MYIYFLPIQPDKTSDSVPDLSSNTLLPTMDGSEEHTEAMFAPAETWLNKAAAGEIILFPPQAFLLTLVSRYLNQDPVGTPPKPSGLSDFQRSVAGNRPVNCTSRRGAFDSVDTTCY